MQQLLTSQRGYIMSSRCVAFRFSLRSRTSKTAATAGSSDCGDGTYVSIPPSENEGYLCNRDVPFSGHVRRTSDWPTNRNPYQSVTGAVPFQRSVASLLTPLLKDGGTGPTQRVSITAVPQPNQWDYWITLGKRTFPWKGTLRSHILPPGVMWRSTDGLAL